MSKGRLIIIGATALVILALVAGVLFYKLYKPVQGPLVPTAAKPQDKGAAPETVQADQVYKDASGFSFKYPKNITVTDTTPDNNTYYSQLSLKGKGGEIVVSIKDTKYKNLEEWLEKDKDAPEEAKLSGATTLGGLSAKQYTGGGKMWTAAISQGVLYLIKGPKDSGYWDSVDDLVASTLAFSKPEQPSGGTGSGSGVIYEGEEVVE